MNNYEQAVKELAPCGNDCSRCASYVDSKIVHLSKELNENLINFENMAKKLKDLMPIFNYYKEFSDILTHNKIKTYGVENFYIEQKNKPRY